MDEKKIPKDRKGVPLSPGDFVWVFLDHSERPDYMAKVLFTGIEKSTLEREGRRGCEPVDNEKIEAL
jgi:hypothetical protein